MLVAAVNGNALGFGTALLALCDVVYASNKVCSYFYSFSEQQAATVVLLFFTILKQQFESRILITNRHGCDIFPFYVGR